MRFKIKPFEQEQKYCFYLIYDEQNNVQYAGVTQYYKLLSLEDAKKVKQFQMICGMHEIYIEVQGLYDTMAHANNQRYTWLMARKSWPLLNKVGKAQRRSQPVMCLDTGEIFTSQKQAQEIHNVNPGQLSQHLNNHPGYLNVKGRRYIRLSAVPLHTQNSAVPLHTVIHIQSGRRAKAREHPVDKELLHVCFDDYSTLGWFALPEKDFVKT